MTLELTKEQQNAIEHGDQPIYVLNPNNGSWYVLLTANVYQRLQALLVENDELNIRETYPIQEQVARSAGWDDPAMDVYNDYDAHRRPQ